MAARTLIFADDETRTPRLFACSGCGEVHSPETYRKNGRADEDSARNAAENCSKCRGYDICRDCGDKTPLHHLQCTVCNRTRLRRMTEGKLAKAEETVIDGPCFGAFSDEFYRDVESARDQGEIAVFGAQMTFYKIDVASTVEGIVDGHHEDASENDLVGIGAFYEAMETFNEEQNTGSYEMDETIKQTIRQDSTFAMIKPDATSRGVEEDMIADMKAAGFEILARKDRSLDRSEAEWLYKEHKDRDHFPDLVDYTISGPVVLLHLQADMDNAPAAFRTLMGATDRTKAAPGTLRAKYAVGYRENSIHGSDSPSAAIDEITRFFGFLSD